MANNNQSKVTTLASVRAGAAHLMELITSTIQAAVAYVFDRAGFVYVKTEENAQTILDFFNTHDLTTDDGIYRFIGKVEDSPVTGFDYKFGLLNADLTVSTEDVVYGDRRDYDDLQEGDKVYTAQQDEVTVTAVSLPTEGYVTLTGFDDPLHVIVGTQYGN